MSDSDAPEVVAQPRTAAGVLFFDEADRVLLVKPTYKPGWEIPGGYLHPGETPSEGAAREVKEELGITPAIGPLLVADWAPHPAEGDKLLFVFDGGILPPNEHAQITPDGVEISDYAFHPVDQIDTVLILRLASGSMLPSMPDPGGDRLPGARNVLSLTVMALRLFLGVTAVEEEDQPIDGAGTSETDAEKRPAHPNLDLRDMTVAGLR